MKIFRDLKTTIIALFVAVVFVAAALSANDKPGPAEKAGKNIDQTVEKAGDKMSNTSEKVGNTMDKQSDKAQIVLSDTEITAKVKASIFSETGLDSMQISVDTVKGVVTLSGKVDSKMNSDRANDLAEAISGVIHVHNHLKIQ